MRIKPLILAILMIWATVVAGGQKTETHTSRSNWNWIQVDGDQKIEVKVEGKVEFNDDYSDVTRIPDTGSLKIFDSRGPRRFHLLMLRGADGALNRDYSVDGRARPFDEEGRQWLRNVLLQAVREGGLDARNRVQKILKKSGPRGLAEELTHVKGDYVRRIYFEEFLQVPGISNDELKSAIKNASQSIRSDYERAQLLLQVGHVLLAKDELIPEYFAVLSRMTSDYERRRILSGLLKRGQLNRDALAAAADSARAIKSDYEKAVFLIQSAEHYHADNRLRSAWFGVLSTFESDYEHHRVLKTMVKIPSLSADALLDVMNSAARIGSDYEKATFLIGSVDLYQSDARLRTALVNVAKTINSAYERGRVQKRLDRADF